MREMIIGDKEQIKIAESPFGSFRWIEFASQKWVVRNDVLRALGYSAAAMGNGVFSEGNSLVAVRQYLPSTSSRISFLNADGIREFGQMKLGRVKPRKLQPQVCGWLLENIFAEPAPEPTIKPLFDDMPSLAEAEQALATLGRFIHSLKGKKE